ncbi:MAG TPA: hypothetical protein VF275_03590 [Gammaproteobacteria bacterium]
MMKRFLLVLVLLVLFVVAFDIHPFPFSIQEDIRGSALIFLLVIVIYFLIRGYLSQRNRGFSPERVVFDEHEVIRHLPDGSVEKIRWDEIDCVSIVTTDTGPWAEDAFWILENAARTKGCMIGNGAEGFEMLLERLQSLVGFRDDQVIEAMGCTSNSRFVVWERTA